MRGTPDPALLPFLEQINRAIADAKAQGIIPTPALAREKLAALSAFVTNIPQIAHTQDLTLETDEHAIALRLYDPAPDETLPLLIYFHGGGHMCGSVELYDPMCRKMALAARALVLSVEYRLAPEHPYPAGLNDAKQVLKHFASLLPKGRHTGEVIIGGDSAGGALCASLTMARAEDPTLTIHKQILLYPSLDYSLSRASVEENGTGFFLEKARIEWYFEHYFPADADPIAASPLHQPLDAQSPQTLLIIAGCDPLRDEALAYAEKLQLAGVKTQVSMFDDMIHAFMNIEDLVPEACAELYRQIGDFIRR